MPTKNSTKSKEAMASMTGSLSLQVTGGGGTTDYTELENLPTINGQVVKGDLTTEDLGIKAGYDASYDAENEHITLSL
jgi:hypothetical protein